MTPEQERQLIERELMRRQQAAQDSGSHDHGLWEHGSKIGSAIDKIADFSEGIGVSGLETYYGVKDLLGLGEEGDKKTLDAWRRAAGESGWGGAGQFTGEMAQFAIPGGGALKGARLLDAANKARRTAKALPVVGDVAGVAAIEAAQLPGEGESRLGNAATATAFGAGGHALGGALRLASAGAKGKSDLFRRWRDEGFKPTVGQAIPVLNRAENLLAYIPITAKGVARQRAQSADSIHRKALSEAAPPNPETLKKFVAKEVDEIDFYKPTQPGHKGTKELQRKYTEAYEAAYPKINDLKPEFVQDVAEVFGRHDDILVGSDLNNVKMLARELSETLQKAKKDPDATYSLIKRKLDKFRTDAGDAEIDKVVRELKEVFTKAMPERNKVALAQIDKQYGRWAATTYAAGTAGARARVGPKDLPTTKGRFFSRQDPYERGVENTAGMFTLDELVQGSGRASPTKYAAGTGDAPMQNFITEANSLVQEQIGALPVFGVRLSQAIPHFGSKQVGDVIAGNFRYQKIMRDILKKYREESAIPYAFSPYRAGAAYEE
jgi:hypothetical protein